MKFHIYLFLLLMLSSLLLIGGGFTSKVISETCCMGHACQPDTQCTVVTGALTAPGIHDETTGEFTAIIGFAVLVGSIIMLHAHYKHKPYRRY